MGNSYSKTEDKEVIIAQNGGSNTAVQSHIQINNILLASALTIFAVIIVILIYKKLKDRQKKWIEKHVESQFIRRMRLRLSGKRDREEGNEPV